MVCLKRETIQIAAEADIVRVRQNTRQLAKETGFRLIDQTRMVTAASELARNTFTFGGGGAATMEILENGARKGLRLTFEDHGPGIPDLDLALTDHYTTGDGLGLGLSGSRRLVNEFDIYSKPGEGTRVTVTRWK